LWKQTAGCLKHTVSEIGGVGIDNDLESVISKIQ